MRNAVAGTARPARADDDLGALCLEGQRLLAMMDAAGACQAFGQFVAEAARTPGWAEHPTLHEAMHRAVAGLGDCLALVHDAQARQLAFQALFQAYQADARSGGNGLAREIPYLMLRRALPPERHMLAAWARQAISEEGPGASEAYWRLLLDLAAAEPGALDALLRECRAAGHGHLVAEKLLDMDRVGEALGTARRELKDTEALLRFANSPAARGQARAVMAIASERLSKAFDPRLADWLAERYAERGDLARALELRLKLLRVAPGRGDYERVKALARRLGTWERLQPELARALSRDRREEALAELALGEGDEARALAYVVKAPERYSEEMVARLAAYAAEASPHQAALLYRHLLERALATGAPASEAEGYLRRVRELYVGEGTPGAWEAYLQELHERFGLAIWG